MDHHPTGISHFAPVVAVPDVLKTINWYKEKLGFDISFTWNDPVDYAVVKKGESVSLHFSKADEFSPEKLPDTTLVYFFVFDVDAIHADFLKRGVEKISSPEDRDYGMRDFDVVDPNGYRLSFGKGITEGGQSS